MPELMIKLIFVFITILIPPNQEFEEFCLEEVNELRKWGGAQPLVLDPKLSSK
jgi:hypothetical protein